MTVLFPQFLSSVRFTTQNINEPGNSDAGTLSHSAPSAEHPLLAGTAAVDRSHDRGSSERQEITSRGLDLQPLMTTQPPASSSGESPRKRTPV